MKKFEYKIIIIKIFSNEDEENNLNELGKDGWEHYFIRNDSANNYHYFKRQIINTYV